MSVKRLRFVHLVFWFVGFFLSGGMFGCSEERFLDAAAEFQDQHYKTENVVVVVIDGPRFEDTWGMKQQPHIPKMAHELYPQSTFFANFKNNGRTITVAGHTAICTGNYQSIGNDGSELPEKASFLQRYLRETSKPSSKVGIISSKIKLNVLANTTNTDWHNRFAPFTNCGKEGGDRSDVATYEEVVAALQTKQPNILIVQLKGPDTNGHANNWEGYLKSLQETDSLVYELWQYLEQDEFYKGKTALLITNDHGRHSEGHKDGFVSHGDGCKGCRHISLMALGPDFEKGKLVVDEYEQVDIAPTIGVLLGVSVPAYNGGKLILPLLRKPGI